MKIPKVAVVNDLSGLGKCSLTTALPILSAMGAQACPLPTGVLSNQTGFSSYTCVDMTEYLDAFTAEWKKRAVSFDAIYTGFLCGTRQTESIGRFIEDFRSARTLVLVDPVLGDHGRSYPALPPQMDKAVMGLVEKADIITPNFTEACLLTKTSRYDPNDLEHAWDLAQQLAESGPSIVVVTGIRQNNDVCNALYLAKTKERFLVRNHWVGHRSYSGTGDILAAVLCGGLVGGMPARDALGLAARFLEASISEAAADGTDPNEGVAFEHHLHLLIGKERF